MVAAEAIIVEIKARRKNWRPLAGSPKWAGLMRHTWLLYHSHVNALGSVNTAVVLKCVGRPTVRRVSVFHE
jgi:hypothetical protein